MSTRGYSLIFLHTVYDLKIKFNKTNLDLGVKTGTTREFFQRVGCMCVCSIPILAFALFFRVKIIQTYIPSFAKRWADHIINIYIIFNMLNKNNKRLRIKRNKNNIFYFYFLSHFIFRLHEFASSKLISWERGGG